MIGPKLTPPTAGEERTAYELCTLRDRDQCVKCHWGRYPQRDHRKNRSQGGRTVVENLHLLCQSCHLWKTEHPDEANEAGWGCPGWADPAEWPASRWISNGPALELVWVLYQRDGKWRVISSDEAHLRRLNEFDGAEVRAT